MKTTFWLGLIVGFGGVLAGAHFFPWAAHARLPSQTTVVANGGRAEQFVIRLPVDRIASGGGAPSGLRGSQPSAALALPLAFVDQPLLVEQFKVRDGAGNVIGLAARHWSIANGTASSAWSLLIPSRGALLLAAPGEPGGAVEAALRRAGYVAGSDWSGEAEIEMVSDRDGAAGEVVGGSDEFAGLNGRYSETWSVTGVGDGGELRGTIALDTITFRGP
jgi:hypothetical protein